MLGAPGGAPTSIPQVSAEETAGLLASLGAGQALAGVVEGLLARLLVTTQDHDDDSDGDGDTIKNNGNDVYTHGFVLHM